MRKLFVAVKLATLTTVLSISLTAISYAGQWEQDASGYRWKEDTGSYVAGTSCWIDGN